MSEEKKVMGVVQILDMLKQGKTRDDIAEFYEVSKAVIKEVFKDERLKGKKTIKKKEDAFILVEDESITEVEQVVPVPEGALENADENLEKESEVIAQEEEKETEEVKEEPAVEPIVEDAAVVEETEVSKARWE